MELEKIYYDSSEGKETLQLLKPPPVHITAPKESNNSNKLSREGRINSLTKPRADF